MSTPKQRIGFLAPMDIELRPLVRDLALEADSELPDTWRGSAGGIELVAVLGKIGMGAATVSTHRLLTTGVDHVMVFGIAGAVERSLPIGTVLAPAVVEDRRLGISYRPPVGPNATHGILSCGDDLITDAPTLTGLSGRGVIALDMETAAVAAVCDGAGVSWSVHRAISDHAGGGLIDDTIMAMAGASGAMDPDVYASVMQDPQRRARIEQLTRDSMTACNAAASDAIATLAAFTN